MEPLIESRFLRNEAPEAAGAEEQIIGSRDDVSRDDEEENDDQTNAQASAVTKLSRAQQAQIAQIIGDTMSRLNQLADAVAYYENARRLESSAAVRKALQRKIADVRSTLRIQHQNAARQPLLHEPLEQDRVVRPRLLARDAPAPKAAAAQGGVKP